MLRVLGFAIAILSMYNIIIPPLIQPNQEKKELLEEEKAEGNKSASIIALLILFGIYIYWYKEIGEWLTIPVSYMMIIVYGFSICEFGHVLFSRKTGALTNKETLALNYTGIFIASIISAGCDAIETFLLEGSASWKTDVLKCSVSIIVYAFCFCLLISLAITPTKHIAKVSVKIIYYVIELLKKWCKRMVKSKLLPGNLESWVKKCHWEKASINGIVKRMEHTIWKGVLFLADIIRYMGSYIIFIILAISQIALQTIVVICSFAICIINKIIQAEKRQVVILSFRVSTIAAMLIVVTQNRLYHIVSSEDVTAILEFIASVIIIPILFEWISSSTQKAANE